MTGTARQYAPIDTDLASLLRPFPGWETEWIHLGPGPESLEGTRVTKGTGSFTVVRTSTAGILRGTTSADSIGLIASAPFAARARSQAQPLGGDVCLVLGTASALDLYLPTDGCVMIIAAPAPPSVADGAHCRALDPEQGALLSRCFDLMEQIRTAPASSPLVREPHRRLRDQLKAVMAAMFREGGPLPQAERARLQRHIAVIRACVFVDTHLHSPIALSDLCSAAGVSTRALEYGFRDFYGLGPMAYVRNLRLCRVRHDLLDPDRNEASVSRAARRWSFTHMGQFSHDYRALFGEMPSKTLAAHQRTAKASSSVS